MIWVTLIYPQLPSFFRKRMGSHASPQHTSAVLRWTLPYVKGTEPSSKVLEWEQSLLKGIISQVVKNRILHSNAIYYHFYEKKTQSKYCNANFFRLGFIPIPN